MKTPRLSKESQEQLLQNFCEALAILHTPEEVLPFLTDLLTKTLLITSRVPVVRRSLVPLATRLPWVFETAVDQLARPA